MSRRFLLAAIGVLFCYSLADAQSQDPPKFEVAAEFTTYVREAFGSGRTEIGVGPRFTFNLNRNVALESAAYFSAERCFSCPNMGRMTQVVGGVKVGKRFEKWGIFAKARPGIVTFSQGEVNILQVPNQTPPTFFGEAKRLTSFAVDLGPVVEFYPSRRIVTRFDVGGTIIHFKRQTRNLATFDSTGNIILIPVPVPARTIGNFQFVASVGYRF